MKSQVDEPSQDLRILKFEAQYRRSMGEESPPFSVRARDISLRAGEVAVLMGDNGSGKTTFLRALSGGAEIECKERKLSRHARFVYGHQNAQDSLFADLRCGEAYFLLARAHQGGIWSLRRCPPLGEITKQLPEEIKATLLEWERRRVTFLSGGQKALLGACALASRITAETLLMDEPAAGLDRRNRLRLATYLRKIAKEVNVPVLVTSHQADFAGALGGGTLEICKGTVRTVTSSIGDFGVSPDGP